jgi:hypothetical protein
MAALTDSGDHMTFNSAGELWSNRSGYAASVKPNGVLTGLVVAPAASGTDNLVDVSAGTVNLAGIETTVNAATDVAITRATPTDTHIICSITVTSVGAIVVVAGIGHTAFSNTRGADGGPPWIPTTSIEIAQVMLSANADAAIATDDIYQVPGTHREMALFPTWEEERIRITNGAIGYAGPTFASALELIHSDDAGLTTVTKKVYASYYTPIFAQIPKASGFKRPANSHSVSSTEYYGGAKATRGTSIGQGSFTVLTDTLNEGVLAYEGDDLWFRFKNDRMLTLPCVYTQGVLGVAETFQVDGGIEVACTISAEVAGERVLA